MRSDSDYKSCPHPSWILLLRLWALSLLTLLNTRTAHPTIILGSPPRKHGSTSSRWDESLGSSVAGTSSFLSQDRRLLTSSRLIAEPFVKGLSGSAHQSFPTAEEAVEAWRENCLVHHANGDHHPELILLAKDTSTIAPLPEALSLRNLRNEMIRRQGRPSTAKTPTKQPPTYYRESPSTPRSTTKPSAPAYTSSPSPTPAPRTSKHATSLPSPVQRGRASTPSQSASAKKPWASVPVTVLSSPSSISSGFSGSSSSSRPKTSSISAHDTPATPSSTDPSSSPAPAVSSIHGRSRRGRPPRNVYGVSFAAFRNMITNDRCVSHLLPL